MRIPESAELVTVTFRDDEYGVPVKVETGRKVYGNYDSLTATEIFDGGRDGLNPELRFTMLELDYKDETILVRGNKRYAVYRTFRPGNGKVELYCERKGGKN